MNVFKAFLNIFGNHSGGIVGVLKVFKLQFAGQVNEQACKWCYPQKCRRHQGIVNDKCDCADNEHCGDGENFRDGVRENHFESVYVVHDSRCQVGKILFAKEGEREFAQLFGERDAAFFAFRIDGLVCAIVRKCVDEVHDKVNENGDYNVYPEILRFGRRVLHLCHEFLEEQEYERKRKH